MRKARQLRAILSVLVVLVATEAFAQDVVVSPVLRIGDEFQLESVRIRENSSKPQQNGKSRTLVNVRVVSATPQGYVLEWVPGETVIDNLQTAQDPLTVAASQSVQGIRFALKLNADGELIGLANEAEVAPKLQAMLHTIVRELSARLPADQRGSFQNLIAQVLSPAVLMSSATREAEIYFGLNGIALAAGEAAEVGLEQPSPIGNGVIPAIFRIHMESATTETALLKTSTVYDAAALMRMTESIARQAGKPIPPEELAKLPRMEMGDDGKYLFNRTVGLMREVIVNRRVSAGPVRQYDGWEIRLINAPKR